MDAHTLESLDFHRVRELLAQRAATELGRALAGAIRPSAKIELVRRWLAQVSELERLCETRGAPPMAGVSDIRPIIERCTPPLRVDVDDIARVGRTLSATHEIGLWLRDLPEGFPELQHLFERVGDFATIASRIRAVIDERGQVRDDASDKLARIRAEAAAAVEQIGRTIDKLLHDANVRKLLQFPNHTFHGDRYVLPLRTECRGRLQGIIHRTSDSGATLYVEPGEAVELNNRITNLRVEEAEEINRLIWALAHEVHINAEAITRTIDTLAVLDLILAKHRMAREFGMSCPGVGEEATLDVRGARHPLLLDMARRRAAESGEPMEIVPIDYRLGQDFDLLVITGPNTGGKTVTLKTIGLLTLMVQAGLPVPADAASTFGVFKTVLIDIGDEQNMAQSLSTFSAHLKRQLDMLRHAGEHALVLMDELGAGTDPEEGAAISRAILDELLLLKSRCVVTTHIGALKTVPLMRPRAENACVEFDEQSMRPTFRLRIGEPGFSNAIAIAQRLGMPKRLIFAARGHMTRKGRALHKALEGTVNAKREAEEARLAAQQAQAAADGARGDAEKAKARLERQSSDFQAWVQRVVHLRGGDPVRVRDFDRDGKIVRIRLDLHRAEVDVGAFTVDVPLGDVLPPETPAPPPRAPSVRPSRPDGPRRPRDGQRREQTGVGGASGGARPGGANQDSSRGESRRDARPPRPERASPPESPPLTEQQAAALRAGDSVYVPKFHRVGTIVRVNAEKKVAAVNVGLLEVELPFSGLSPAQKGAS